MMIPTMSDYASYLGTNLATLQKMQTKTKSFRIEDILDIRDQQDHIYTGVRPECEVSCYDKMRLDGKRIRGPRKDRTIFSKIQLFRLERRFHDQKYLSSYEKALIAHSLQLTQQQVQTWFQNRRAKAKREEREKKKQNVKSITSPPPSSSSSYDTEPAATSSTSALENISETSPVASQAPASLTSPQREEEDSAAGTSARLSPAPTSLESSPTSSKSPLTTSSPLITSSPLTSSSPLVSSSPLITSTLISPTPLVSSSPLISPTPLVSSSPLISPVMRLVSMCSSVGSELPSSSSILAGPVVSKPLQAADKQTDKVTNSAIHRFSIDHLTSHR